MNFTTNPRARSISILDLESLVESVELKCRQAGLLIPNGSRYNLYGKSLHRYRRVVPRTDDRDGIRRFTFHCVQLEQLAWIIDTLSSEPATPHWRDKILEALRGTPVPDPKASQSLPRDIQFELLLAAWCKQAGYCPRLEEPDIVVVDQLGEYGIAVKRPRSWTRLRKLVRTAGKQVEGSSRPGVIALDLSLLIDSEARFHVAANQSEHHASLEGVVQNFLAENIAALRQSVSTAEVFAVLVHAQNTAYFASENAGGDCTVIRGSNLCHHEDKRHYRLRALLQAMAAATEGDTEGIGALRDAQQRELLKKHEMKNLFGEDYCRHPGGVEHMGIFRLVRRLNTSCVLLNGVAERRANALETSAQTHSAC